MPCKKGTKKHSGFQETEAKSDESSKISKTKHACIVEAHEFTRQRLESSRTKARVAWKVVLCFSNRASICSHALVLLSQTRSIGMTGWRTSFSLQTFVLSTDLRLISFGLCFLAVYNHRFRHVWIVDPCLRNHISLQPCVSNTFGLFPVSVFKHLSLALP